MQAGREHLRRHDPPHSLPLIAGWREDRRQEAVTRNPARHALGPRRENGVLLPEELSGQLRGADGDDVDAAESEACDFGVESLHVVLYPPESWLVPQHLRQAADDRVSRWARWKRVFWSFCDYRSPFVE